MKPFTVTLAATVDGHTVATADARRLPMAKGVTQKSLRPAKDGVYADLFLPPRSTTREPALLMFGGAEGGLADETAQAAHLASHGCPVMALAYFKEPGLPSTLRNTPLEYSPRRYASCGPSPASTRTTWW
ncbi:hypothetical protein [Leekyejoonella antrihumi]|uniref:Uncharacterized protein n=1 Tax=Leekyejoonella antrihumi TaxID=1660198 RepID=A0A563E0D7_9MICO|nr:hypothetical protein [Leekyejoonella antrihumi]TWP35839.1 hypothetical protein FGL98_12630 [Leekyejoonella antrihumi]